MGYLFSIETLRLNNNGFVGELPSQLKNCRNLTLFNLAENKLSGSIPEWLGASLPNLTILILQSNNFYGSIPPQLCHLTRIQLLDLSMNNISGTIPKCLNNLTTLTKKGSSSQTIQHSFLGANANLTFVEVYDDEASLIWKGLRAEFKSNLGLLKSIDLSSNKLIGEIPSEITCLVGLISLNLSRNQINRSNTFKDWKFAGVRVLDLSRNQINGRIPTSLSRIASLGHALRRKKVQETCVGEPRRPGWAHNTRILHQHGAWVCCWILGSLWHSSAQQVMQIHIFQFLDLFERLAASEGSNHQAKDA
ncbi:putative LRR receptor-like serine/threonine-protein kinase [Prunus yedoensis var. nudiflora]|uniref:Putative LRR receptor-like serine/threonine-protein kinase n=1 Tax=Prunus yedoensis var. nudiflora TaxID=2094558 RepID=A0A314UE28_PRUYE|nr:putative LRR receptor-like serine/threonine-protein kinase [Prunus yedoensis var. nudiflora]